MSVACTILIRPNLMKPLPELPPPSPPVYMITGSVAKPPPLPHRSVSTNHKSQHVRIFDSPEEPVQRPHTVPANFVKDPLVLCPFEPDRINVDLSDLMILTPRPLTISKPQPPPYSIAKPAPSPTKPKASHQITYPRVPQRSATDSHLLTSRQQHRPVAHTTLISQPRRHSSRNSQFDRLPSIETRLDAWIQENQHHAEPSPDQDMHELRCDKCRFGVGLIDVQNPRVTGGGGVKQWCSPKQRQMQRSTQMRMRSCTAPVGKSTVLGGSLVTVREVDESASGSETESERDGKAEQVTTVQTVQEMQEMRDRKSMWDKPSFRGFLIKVGGGLKDQ